MKTINKKLCAGLLRPTRSAHLNVGGEAGPIDTKGATEHKFRLNFDSYPSCQIGCPGSPG